MMQRSILSISTCGETGIRHDGFGRKSESVRLVERTESSRMQGLLI